MEDREPDSVFEVPTINEIYWHWLDENTIEAGDLVRVRTSSHEWKKPFTVTKNPDCIADRGLCMESERGTEYQIVTFSSVHPLEPEEPILRKWNGFDSMGIIERVELYKE